MSAVSTKHFTPMSNSNDATSRSGHTSSAEGGPRAAARRLRRAAEVAMMKSAQHRSRTHGPGGTELDGALIRRVLRERQVGAAAVVVPDIFLEEFDWSTINFAGANKNADIRKLISSACGPGSVLGSCRKHGILVSSVALAEGGPCAVHNQRQTAHEFGHQFARNTPGSVGSLSGIPAHDPEAESLMQSQACGRDLSRLRCGDARDFGPTTK